jgi:hypothetical protein
MVCLTMQRYENLYYTLSPIFVPRMKLSQRIESLHWLGEEIRTFLDKQEYKEWNHALKLAEQQNGWFTRDNIIMALKGFEPWLTRDALQQWANTYHLPEENNKPITVSVVMAGNIPLVGFHDFLCVLITGNIIEAKLSSSDNILLSFLAKRLIEIEPLWKGFIKIVEKLSPALQAVIATGSNNTAKHFEYYFKSVPHIIRRNRNGVAVLNGKETEQELSELGKDIFSYFGLGCRNVSKLYVPDGYDFSTFFRSIEKYGDVIQHNKYANNYAYNRTIYLMDSKVFTDNNFLAVIENKQISSPIAVLHFEYYKDLSNLGKELTEHTEQIQCIAANKEVAKKLGSASIPIVEFGHTQSPGLTDYADGVDVIKFILEQNR